MIIIYNENVNVKLFILLIDTLGNNNYGPVSSDSQQILTGNLLFIFLVELHRHQWLTSCFIPLLLLRNCFIIFITTIIITIIIIIISSSSSSSSVSSDVCNN